MMAGRDRISELPAEILDNILGFLPIVEAARSAVLSTIWRDNWSSLTQLKFDFDFFHIDQKYYDNYNNTSPCLYVINKVLMHNNGPIRKFVLNFSTGGSFTNEPNSRTFDFDQWFLFITQKGAEEIFISFLPDENEYMLPNCIFSCLTLKKLNLSGVSVAQINAPCIFLNVTSLSFYDVYFDSTNLLDSAADVLMLKTLSFIDCQNVPYFNITAPRLGCLTITAGENIENYIQDGFLPMNLDLASIQTLYLDFDFKYLATELNRWGPELNVECLELSRISFADDYEFSAFIHSLHKFPKLCKLDICLSFDAAISGSILSELHSAAQMFKMLHTLKLSSFDGLKSEMQFIKVVLACFFALEKVIIIRLGLFDSDKEFKIMQELLHFPRASKKAKIVYI